MAGWSGEWVDGQVRRVGAWVGGSGEVGCGEWVGRARRKYQSRNFETLELQQLKMA